MSPRTRGNIAFAIGALSAIYAIMASIGLLLCVVTISMGGELKTTVKMRMVKSQTGQGVLKELAVYALVYNLIHCVMVKAAQQQSVEPHRISFIDILRWLLSAEPGEAVPQIIVNPDRPDRHEPRVLKDQQDTYTKMCRPRAELRKELKQQLVAA